MAVIGRRRLALVAATVIALLLAVSPAAAAPGDLTTEAASGPTAPAPALEVAISPEDLAVAPDGTVFFSDASRNVVWRMDTSGLVTRFAGDGVPVAGPDGVAATSSGLIEPSGLVALADGSVLVSDERHHQVRRIRPDGVIEPFAGTGIGGFSGDGGPATMAQLESPTGLVEDSFGNVYVADTDSNRVRRVAPDGTIETYAGTGESDFSGDGGPAAQATFAYPTDLAIAPDAGILVLDRFNYRIRHIAPDGTVSTVAGNGSRYESAPGGNATSWQTGALQDIDVAADGTVFVSGTSHKVHAFTIGGTVWHVAGTGVRGNDGDGAAATAASLDLPRSVAAHGNEVLIGAGDSLRRIDAADVIDTVAGTGNGSSGAGGPAVLAQIERPIDAAYDPTGRLVIVDRYAVRRLELDGTLTHVAGRGYYSDDPFVEGAIGTDAVLYGNESIAVDAGGAIYVGGYKHIRRIDPSGAVTTFAGNGSYGYSGDGPALSERLTWVDGMSFDEGGNLILADTYNHRVRRVTPAGQLETIAGNGIAGTLGDGGPAGQARINAPVDVTVTDDGQILIATNGRVIRRVDGANRIWTAAGSGESGLPEDLGSASLQPLPGPTSVTDIGSGSFAFVAGDLVLLVNADGVIATLAGPGSSGAHGEGIPARGAAFLPDRVRVAPNGDLIVVDDLSYRVWRIEKPGPPSSMPTPTGTPGIGSITATWSPPPADGGVAVSGYRAVARPGNAFCETAAPATTCVIEDLEDGTPYTIDVQATNLAGESVVSPLSPAVVPGARATSVAPTRLLDTRDGTGGSTTRWGVLETRDVLLAGQGPIPADATAVVMNLTAVHPTENTHLTVWPAGDDQPSTSSLNVSAGGVRPNLVTVGIGTNGAVSIANNSGSVDVVGDVVAYYGPSGDGLTNAVTPTRVLDSRDGTGGHSEPWGPGTARPVVVRGGSTGVPGNASAVVLNVTGVTASADTFLTVYGAGEPLPHASNLNLVPGETAANLVVSPIGTGDAVTIFNNSGTVDVIADVVGYVTPTGSVLVPVTPTRLVDSRDGTGGFSTPWEADQTREVTVAGGALPVPSDATAVLVNLTAVGPSGSTHLTVWPSGSPTPTASNLNVAPGDVRPNLVLVPVGPSGAVSVRNNSGAVDVLVDVVAFLR